MNMFLKQNKRKRLHKNRVRIPRGLDGDTNMAAETSPENTLFQTKPTVLHDVYLSYFSPEVMVNLTVRARGNFVTFIEVDMRPIERIPGQSLSQPIRSREKVLCMITCVMYA